MGLDFSIDTSPRVLVNGEEKDVSDVRYMFEDLEYTFKEHTKIEVEIIPALDLDEPESNQYGEAARWSYSGFMRFREKLAKELGLNLRMMYGFLYDNPYMLYSLKVEVEQGIVGLDMKSMPLSVYEQKDSLIAWWKENAVDWATLEHDPIHDLLHHSDCDGDLTADECRAIAPRIRALVEGWPEDDYDREQALKLANMMDVAARNNRRLIFH